MIFSNTVSSTEWATEAIRPQVLLDKEPQNCYNIRKHTSKISFDFQILSCSYTKNVYKICKPFF